MNFLAPAMLSGLVATGLPPLIHLIGKFRVKKTQWAAMSLLANAVKKSKQRVKLDDLILMIARCLLLALVVFAFARPALKALGMAGEIQGSVASIVLLDQSVSMGQRSGSLTRFDLAKNEIRTWLESLDPKSTIGLRLMSSRPTQTILPPANDHALFRKSLDDARLSDAGNDMVTALNMAVASLKQVTEQPREIRIYTDGQANAFQKRDELRKIATDNPDIVIRTIIVGSQQQNNLAITKMMPDGEAVVGQPTRFTAEVSNFGTVPSGPVKVKFTVDENISAGTKVIPQIAPGETLKVNSVVNFVKGGPRLVTAEINTDDFDADNERVAAVEVIGRMKVLLAGLEPLGADYDQGVFFLSHALVPVSQDAAARYFLAATKARMSELFPAITGEVQTRPTAVFLCDPGEIQPDLVAALDTYVKDGGNLVVFPGLETDVTRWTNSSAFGSLLPGTLGAVVDAPLGAPKTWQGSGSHPVTEFWNETSNGSLATVQFHKYCPMTLKTSVEPSVLISMADGQPAVAEWQHGKGTVVLFNASESLAWTNHPLHPSFVPFFQRLMVSFQQSSVSNLTLQPGEPFRKQVHDFFRNKDFAIREPGAEAARTAGQVVVDGDRSVLRYTATQAVGTYQAFSGPHDLATFVVQMDPAESDLRMVDPAVPKELSEVERTAAKASARPVVVKEYWTLLMWTVLGLALVELVLAHTLGHARQSA